MLLTEGPGWPRFDIDAPSRCGLVYLPEIVRDHFIDENAEATPEGKLWPQGTQCLVDEGDVILTMHSIPHSGSRHEWGTPRMNMIWRIRAKKRQPNFVHNGGTDHPDRLGPNGINVRASLNRLNRCSLKTAEKTDRLEMFA